MATHKKKSDSPDIPAREAQDTISRELCRRAKQLRADRNWSLDVLSKACGVSRSMLSQIERGQANPTLAVAFRIAEAFGMSLGELVEAPRIGPGSEDIPELRDNAASTDFWALIRPLPN